MHANFEQVLECVAKILRVGKLGRRLIELIECNLLFTIISLCKILASYTFTFKIFQGM